MGRLTKQEEKCYCDLPKTFESSRRIKEMIFPITRTSLYGDEDIQPCEDAFKVDSISSWVILLDTQDEILDFIKKHKKVIFKQDEIEDTTSLEIYDDFREQEKILMGYTVDDSMVRVDFFKPSGKWYTTEEVQWIGWSGNIFEEFKLSLRNHFKDNPKRLSDMDAICLEPFNENSFPIQIKNGGWIEK